MQPTTFLSNHKIAFAKNNLFKIIAAVFAIIWIAFYATALDKTDWWIENILVFIFIIIFIDTDNQFLLYQSIVKNLQIVLILHRGFTSK